MGLPLDSQFFSINLRVYPSGWPLRTPPYSPGILSSASCWDTLPPPPQSLVDRVLYLRCLQADFPLRIHLAQSTKANHPQQQNIPPSFSPSVAFALTLALSPSSPPLLPQVHLDTDSRFLSQESDSCVLCLLNF